MDLEMLFPRLRGQPYRVTSPADPDYNCIAWALGESDGWWSPVEDPEHLWPIGLPSVSNGDTRLTVSDIRIVFEHLGFVSCVDGELVDGIEKIALYASDGEFRHVARQLPSGRWTSKLGGDRDIEHSLNGIEGTAGVSSLYRYGFVVEFMQRERADPQA